MRKFIVKAANKSVFVICLLMACVLSFFSCEKDDGGDEGGSSSTGILSVVSTIPGVFSVEIKAKYSSEKFIKLVPDSPQPSEYGVLASIDGNPTIDNYKYKLSTRQLGVDNSTFVVKNYNIQSNTTYNYVPYIKVGDNYYYGDVKKFTTEKADITMSLSVGSISILSVNAKVDCSGSNASNINSFGVFYSENINYVSNVDSLVNAQNSTCVNKNDSIKLNGLSINTKYYLVAYSKVGAEYFLSEVKNFTTKEFVFSSDAVDLGLSVKWASCNLGAIKPEQYGKYLAWGETAEKSVYSDSTSIWSGKTYSDLRRQGVIDGDDNITLTYDPVRQILGGTWRSPRSSEMEEFCSKCDFYKYTLNGVKGYLAIGPNYNYIFLPAAGYRSGINLYNEGIYCCSWSTEVESYSSEDEFYTYSSVLLISSDRSDSRGITFAGLYMGFPIRPVSD